MQPYDSEIEKIMKRYYNSLSEKDRRRYADLEALKFGHGGRSYIAGILGCSRRTVSKGAREVSQMPKREVEARIRKPGGGRKSYKEKIAEIDEQFLAVLRHHTAGDPMDERVRWTDLSLGEIVTASRRLCASFLMISCPYGTIVPFLSLNQMGKLFNHDSLVEPISAQETRVFEKRQARREVR